MNLFTIKNEVIKHPLGVLLLILLINWFLLLKTGQTRKKFVSLKSIKYPKSE